LKFDPNQSIGFILNDVARLQRNNFDKQAKSAGLTRAQWSAIAYLYTNNGIRQIDLAELLDVAPITLARLIDRLEASGWVERQDDVLDRRAKKLFLTDKVDAVINQMQLIGQKVRNVAFKNITIEEQEQLKSILLKVRSNLSK
jgi:DNA-binding MarR family transcriptional regulator